MANDGKRLENLVSFVEQIHLPSGFVVKTREKIFDGEGRQIAEFDIEIRGKLGTTDIAWLIECRDRPNEGSAPGAWIEQLYGRRMLFGFNKVTAVSTTGFSPGAIQAAAQSGIELREVNSLDPESFRWLSIRGIDLQQRNFGLLGMEVLIAPCESEDVKSALAVRLGTLSAADKFLRVVNSDELVAPTVAFANAVDSAGDMFGDIAPNGEAKKVSIHAEYAADDDHFLIDTSAGPVRIRAIKYSGELSLRVSKIAREGAAEYKHGSGEEISETVLFQPQLIMGVKIGIEMHRIAETGETHVILRRHPT